jgi:uncharacterized protein (TIGR01777 family)
MKAAMPSFHFSDRPEHVLVTGATGFIGRRLVAALLADGHRVSALTRRPDEARRLLGPDVRCVADLYALDVPVDGVVNLAGAPIIGPRWTGARRAALRASRTGLTEKLVAWIAQATEKPSLMLSGSAIGYYGVQAQDDPAALTEASPPQAIFMSTLCQEWEQAAGQARRHGVTVACLRTAVVLGQGGGALASLLLPIRLGVGGPLGTGRQQLSWIHLDDVLGAIAHLWRRHRAGASLADAYNLSAPDGPVTQLAFSRTAAQLAHRPCFMPTPAWVMRALLGEQAQLLTEGQRVLPARLLAEGFAFAYPRLPEALAGLLA